MTTSTRSKSTAPRRRQRNPRHDADPAEESRLAIQDAEATESERVMVTPAIAMKWLQENPRPNRIITQAKVNQYAREMITGRWRYNAEPIRFNPGEELLDGQHRLWAIVESEVTLPMMVVRNLPDDTIFITDTGKSRTVSQFLSIKGEKDTSILAAAVTAHHRWLCTSTYNILSPNMLPTIQDLLTVFDDHGNELKKYLKEVRPLRSRRLGSPGLWASIVLNLDHINHDDCTDYFRKFLTLEMLEENHPVMKLRRRIEMARSPRGGMSQVDMAPLILKAWNLYRKGETITQLAYRAGGATPEVYPVPA